MARISNAKPGKPRQIAIARSTRKSRPLSPRTRTRAELKRAIVDAFREEFPTDTIDVSDGYQDNIHILVVSRKFDPMSERQKTDMMWTLVKSAGLNKKELDLITLLMAYSPAELK